MARRACRPRTGRRDGVHIPLDLAEGLVRANGRAEGTAVNRVTGGIRQLRYALVRGDPLDQAILDDIRNNPKSKIDPVVERLDKALAEFEKVFAGETVEIA